jgi:hypothetical protein
MANSPSHRFGQIIGGVFEEAVREYLRPLAEQYSLYFDYPHKRKARNSRKEIRLEDINGNTHKLDIVMEIDGDENHFGKPRVFIEVAWRKYPKHSKNKAQEISGAIRPLIQKYKDSTPFFGAIIAGVFTQPSIDQMVSEGFVVIHIAIETIEKAFKVVGIDAHWDKDTPEYILQKKIDKYNALSQSDVKKIKDELLKLAACQLEEFRVKLCNSLERKIVTIRIIPIWRDECAFSFSSAFEACHFIEEYKESPTQPKFYRFEICIRYSNGDKIEALYNEKSHAIAFLQSIEE